MAKAQLSSPKKIVISRTDSIGDVALTLPLVGILKEKFPACKIIFLGNTYTRPIIACCQHVDEIWEWNLISQKSLAEQIQFLAASDVDTFIHVFPRKEIARAVKKAKIKNRIGTSHRLFHWTTCNHKVDFTRKNSPLHEAQLNTKLLSPFGITQNYSLTQLQNYAAFNQISTLAERHEVFFNAKKKHIILHPKSQGSALEWGVPNFIKLAKSLDKDLYNIYFTGTEKEGLLFRDKIPQQENIFDLTGKMTLTELIAFIGMCDALIAASTGPLHIAGLSNINAIGLFSSRKPIHAGRWQPLGNKVFILEDKNNSSSTQPLNIPIRDISRALEERL